MKEKVKELIDLVKDSYLDLGIVNINYSTVNYSMSVTIFSKDTKDNRSIYICDNESAFNLAKEIISDENISFSRVIKLIDKY